MLECPREEGLCFFWSVGDQALDSLRGSDDSRQDVEPFGLAASEQLFAVDQESVEKERVERKLAPQRFDGKLAAEAAHRRLERRWPPALCEGDGFAVEDELPGGQCEGRFYDLRNTRGHVVEA